MNKVSIGIPVYGTQSPLWWTPFALNISNLHTFGIELCRIHTATTMLTDCNRNAIVDEFLKTDSEWLFWVDADNLFPMGTIRRLLDTGKKLITGMYVLKGEEATAVAYTREGDNRYRPITDFDRGDIIPIDMAGMGCTLVHRSVYEDIRAQYTAVQTYEAGIIPIHNSDIKGELPDHCKSYPHIAHGIYQYPVCKPTTALKAFPFYVLMYGRTEDVIFYEMAKRAGHQAWCDTSIVSEHIGLKGWGWDEFIKRRTLEEQRLPSKIEIEVNNARA
jgi:hypothetical protein